MLHKGLILLSIGENQVAKDIFVNCINTGNHYDPRITMECAIQLRKILAKEGHTDFKLEKLIESFRNRQRDFIFLVDQSKSSEEH